MGILGGALVAFFFVRQIDVVRTGPEGVEVRTPLGSIRANQGKAETGLPEYPGALVECNDHVGALVERFAHYATVIRGGITQAADVEVAGSAAVYTDISRGVDRQLWVLEAHLQR